MLINLRTMLKAASAKKMAVGAFNVYNVESLQAVLAATKASNHAVILSFGEKYDQHMPIEAMAELVKFYGHTSSQPIVLHLDHCKQESNVIRAIRAGFTSIMYDGSHLPVAENASRSAEIVRISHAVHVSVEGELGYLNEETGQGPVGNEDTHTQVRDVAAYTAASGVDAVAIAIGNAHIGYSLVIYSNGILAKYQNNERRYKEIMNITKDMAKYIIIVLFALSLKEWFI